LSENSPISTEIKEDRLFPVLVRKLAWGIVVLFSLYLPFQIPIWKALNLPHKFLWTDEFFVATAFILFLLIFVYQGKIKREASQILFCLLILGVIGIISGLYNSNPAIVTANGIFDYIKNFLAIPVAIPVFCLFSIPQKKVTGLYNILHRLVLFLCFIAILQEISFFLGLPVEKIGVSFVDIRFGLMRTPSLMGHPNIFGLYALLFFILDFSLYRRIRWQNILLACGIFLSLSRMVWAAFFISLFFLLIQEKRKKMLAIFVVATIVISFAIPYFYLRTAKELGSENYFRGYTLTKSIEIWKDYPILGIGPGMYGGVVSVVFNSPVYEQYGFSPHWFAFMSRIRSLDQFWSQILAEMGLLGTLAFVFLLFTLFRVARKESLNARDYFRKRLLLGFSVVPVVLVVYLFGSGLNLTAFLLTYGMLFGMVLGMKDEGVINQ